MSSEFVAAMEDVLDLYVEPRDPERPVVCFDETSTQLPADVREPLPAKPGRPRREDYEYQRAGTRNLFLSCEPRAGWRHVAITKQRTMQDFAHQMRWLVILEAGSQHEPTQFNRREADMLPRLFWDGGMRATQDGSMLVYQGRGVGGSTVHNLCYAVRTPDAILKRWTAEFGVRDLSPADLGPSLERVEDALAVKQIPEEQVNGLNRLVRQGCQTLGWHGLVQRHNRGPCPDCSAGCVLGCPHSGQGTGKQSMAVTYVPKALQAGARLYTDCLAQAVLTENGRAAGVTARLFTPDGGPPHRLTVHSQAVILAAGAVNSTQLLADVREPLPAKPGRPRREDYEYQRAGTRNLFLICEPRAGWRHVAITKQRTMQDFAHQMRWLVDEAYPDVPVIRLVLDNLNTHRTASLYETFPPAEARRIAKRLEFHHTPKRGSWLNMAEIEFSVLARACLKGRNPDEDALQRNISAYEAQRNTAGTTINWRFTAQDARAKMRRLYPDTSTLTEY